MATNTEQKPLTKKQLEAQIAELTRKLNETQQIPSVKSTEAQNEKIQQDEYVGVMSLVPYPLNISTRKDGSGVTKTFTRLGEIKEILYKDLMDIIENHRNFAERGEFYVLDPRVVRRAGLDSFYSKILTKEKIEEILSSDAERAIKLYESANKTQQELIILMLITKLRDDPDGTDLNVISRFSTISKVNIVDMAEFGREVIKEPGTED